MTGSEWDWVIQKNQQDANANFITKYNQIHELQTLKLAKQIKHTISTMNEYFK